MQKVLSPMRKAIQQYNMIENGDKIAVGVSGGKDSLVLLAGLSYLRRFIGISYTLEAVTIDMGFTNPPVDYEPLQKLCHELDVPLHIIKTQIGEIIFDARQEKNPCSLCARMRRGCLHDAAKALGCNKIALGHHKDDAIETFLMNLFNGGHIGCFSPVTYLSRKNLTMIRPLILCDETLIKHAAKAENLPVARPSCPADGHTNRQQVKDAIAKRERTDRGFKARIFGAMIRAHIDGL